MTGVWTVVDHDGELVTTNVGQRAPVPDHVTQATGDGFEQLVTARVSQAVVDRAKSVEIEHQNGQRVGLRRGASQTRRETLFETRPAAVSCKCLPCHRFPTLSVSSVRRDRNIRAWRRAVSR